MAAATIVRGPAWDEALEGALREADPLAKPAQLALLFASAEYSEHFGDMVQRVQQATGAEVVAGCSGQGIIGPEREIEDEPAVSLMTLSLPGAALRAVHIGQQQLAAAEDPAAWHRLTGVAPAEVNAWLVFADPFRLDCETLIGQLEVAYPDAPIVGGLASGPMRPQITWVFLNGEVFDQGAVLVAVGGAYTVKSVVSQGCDPIGEPWIITAAQGNVVQSISQRPAYEVLVETLRALPEAQQQRASRNLLVGLAMDEYKDAFGRGDFLIRQIVGADPDSGALAIGANLRVGQTIQFQIRDAAAADEDLRQMLGRAREDLNGEPPAGVLLCACNGRGQGLFGVPDHDARGVAQQLGNVPVAGFFCNGEIGPVGKHVFLHGFTASMALFIPKV